jgi:hypothetical protein
VAKPVHLEQDLVVFLGMPLMMEQLVEKLAHLEQALVVLVAGLVMAL